jgi:hypothetical protein
MNIRRQSSTTVRCADVVRDLLLRASGVKCLAGRRNSSAAIWDNTPVPHAKISCRPSCRCIVCLLVSGNREIDDFMTVPRSRPG